MKNKLLKTSVTIVLLLSLLAIPFVLHADEDDSDDEDIRDVRGELDSIEEDRRKEVEEQLLLDIPEVTDNPNHVITFRNPSEEENVYIEIDGDDFKEIESPYNLPSLSLGRHNLIFKFHDEDNTERKIERTITVIPRAPKIKPPEITEEGAKISGSALPNSQVEIFITNETYNERVVTNVDHQGEWEKEFSNEIDDGVYTVIAITRSRGYSSQYSEPLVFRVDRTSPIEEKDLEDQDSVAFSLEQIDLRDIPGTINNLTSNRDLFIALVSTLAIGLVLGIIIFSVINKLIQRKSKKVFKQALNKSSKRNKLQDLRERQGKSATEETEEEEEDSDFEKQFFDEEDEIQKPEDESEEIQETEKDDTETEQEKEENTEEKDDGINPEKLKDKFKALKGKKKKERKGMSSKAKNVEKSMTLSREEFLEEYEEHKPKSKRGKAKGKKKDKKTD